MEMKTKFLKFYKLRMASVSPVGYRYGISRCLFLRSLAIFLKINEIWAQGRL